MAEVQVQIAKFCEHAHFCRDGWQAVADQAQGLQVLASTNFWRKFIKIAGPKGGAKQNESWTNKKRTPQTFFGPQSDLKAYWSQVLDILDSRLF